MRVVLLLAAGAGWETRALGLLGGRRDLVVLKRCVDVDDLLATAAAGQADTAVVALDAPGFDLAAVDRLRGHDVRTVAVAPGQGQLDQATVRATRIGVATVVADDDLETLADSIVADSVVLDQEPEPAQPTSTPPTGVKGRVITVWGAAGAPGRTTVATSIAAALARTRRTTLVDADPFGGSVAQALGILDEVSGLLAAARLAGTGMLEERFSSVQRALDDRLTVVTGLPRPDRWTEVRPGTLELLAGTAVRLGHVVVDTGAGLDQDDGGRPGRGRLTLAAIEAADEVVVVGTADPVGLSRLARSLVDLRDTHPTTAVRVVVNRMRPTIGWTERDVGQMLADVVRPAPMHFLPDDRAVVDRALVTGRTLLETDADSPLALAVMGLADAISPGPTPRTGGRGRRR
jgi:MinD-like ATPase involved in chromosome partitioning or flagellar assembly